MLFVQQQQIVQTLRATQQVASQLAGVALSVKEALAAQSVAEDCVVLYGSLALSCGLAAQAPGPNQEYSKAASAYITNRSDVDFALLLPDGTQAMSLVNKLVQHCGGEAEWRHEQATVVPIFSLSQWTLVNSQGVRLDLTCFTDEVAFNRFRERQASFRASFWQMRHHLHVTFGSIGVVTFDAYIYMLKAFAAMESGSAMTSFQAICLGVFFLELEKKMLVPSAHGLFNKFLNFCCSFFGKKLPPGGRRGQRLPRLWCGCVAIDLSGGARLLPRVGRRAHAELYFAAAEERCGVPVSEWQNVLHNIDPPSVCETAQRALRDWFCPSAAGAAPTPNGEAFVPLRAPAPPEARPR